MLSAIRDFFEKNLASAQPAVGKEHTLELATATLLAEVVRLDGEIDPRERAAVLEAVRRRFHLAAPTSST